MPATTIIAQPSVMMPAYNPIKYIIDNAYKTMRDMGLIENKRIEDYLREVQTASSLQQYFEKKDEYERTLQSSGSDYVRRLARQQFNTWKTTSSIHVIFLMSSTWSFERLNHS